MLTYQNGLDRLSQCTGNILEREYFHVRFLVVIPYFWRHTIDKIRIESNVGYIYPSIVIGLSMIRLAIFLVLWVVAADPTRPRDNPKWWSNIHAYLRWTCRWVNAGSHCLSFLVIDTTIGNRTCEFLVKNRLFLAAFSHLSNSQNFADYQPRLVPRGLDYLIC